MASKSSAGSTGPIYEDFLPISGQKEEQEAHVLYIHLPDFSKEQLRVSYIDFTRTIRVQGERPLGKNKWSRFNRTFLIPENCLEDKIQGKFQEGILTITIPKQTIAPPQPTAAPKQEGTKITPKKREPSSALAPPPKEPSSTTGPPPEVPSPVAAPPPKEPSPAEAPPPKVPSSVVSPPPKEPSPVAAPPPKVTPPAEAPPPKLPSSVVAPPPKEPSPVAAPPPPPPPPKVTSSAAVPPSKTVAAAQLPQGETIEKDQESSLAFQTPQKTITEPTAQKGQGQGDTSAKATAKQSTEKEYSQTKDKEKEVDAPSKAPYESKPQKQEETCPPFETKKNTEEQRSAESRIESIKKSDETAREIAAPKGPEKKGDVVGEKGKVTEETSFIEKAKEMKNVAVAMMKTALEKKEDRHLIINVGVAVLVIVAVGAYVSYKIRSSAKAKD